MLSKPAERNHFDRISLMQALVPPISSSYSGCSKLVKELEIEKRP